VTRFILYEERAWDTSVRSPEGNDLEDLLWRGTADDGAHPNLSVMVKPLNPTAEEKSDLIAFLKVLTGEPISSPSQPRDECKGHSAF
jgi:hypothetical protein